MPITTIRLAFRKTEICLRYGIVKICQFAARSEAVDMILSIFKRKFVGDVERIYTGIYRDASAGRRSIDGMTFCKPQVISHLERWLSEEKSALDAQQYTSMADVGDSVYRVKVWSALQQIHAILEGGGNAAPRNVIVGLYKPATQLSDLYFEHLQLHRSTPLSRALAEFFNQPLPLARQLHSEQAPEQAPAESTLNSGTELDDTNPNDLESGIRAKGESDRRGAGLKLEALESLIAQHLAGWAAIQDLEAILASAGRPVPKRGPYWAIVYGIADSLGQSVGAELIETLVILDIHLRKQADGEVASRNAVTASRNPIFRNWLVEAGAATHAIRTMTASPTEVLMPLAQRYREWTEAHPD